MPTFWPKLLVVANQYDGKHVAFEAAATSPPDPADGPAARPAPTYYAYEKPAADLPPPNDEDRLIPDPTAVPPSTDEGLEAEASGASLSAKSPLLTHLSDKLDDRRPSSLCIADAAPNSPAPRSTNGRSGSPARQRSRTPNTPMSRSATCYSPGFPGARSLNSPDARRASSPFGRGTLVVTTDPWELAEIARQQAPLWQNSKPSTPAGGRFSTCSPDLVATPSSPSSSKPGRYGAWYVPPQDWKPVFTGGVEESPDLQRRLGQSRQAEQTMANAKITARLSNARELLHDAYSMAAFREYIQEHNYREPQALNQAPPSPTRATPSRLSEQQAGGSSGGGRLPAVAAAPSGSPWVTADGEDMLAPFRAPEQPGGRGTTPMATAPASGRATPQSVTAGLQARIQSRLDARLHSRTMARMAGTNDTHLQDAVEAFESHIKMQTKAKHPQLTAQAATAGGKAPAATAPAAAAAADGKPGLARVPSLPDNEPKTFTSVVSQVVSSSEPITGPPLIPPEAAAQATAVKTVAVAEAEFEGSRGGGLEGGASTLRVAAGPGGGGGIVGAPSQLRLFAEEDATDNETGLSSDFLAYIASMTAIQDLLLSHHAFMKQHPLHISWWQAAARLKAEQAKRKRLGTAGSDGKGLMDPRSPSRGGGGGRRPRSRSRSPRRSSSPPTHHRDGGGSRSGSPGKDAGTASVGDAGGQGAGSDEEFAAAAEAAAAFVELGVVGMLSAYRDEHSERVEAARRARRRLPEGHVPQELLTIQLLQQQTAQPLRPDPLPGVPPPSSHLLSHQGPGATSRVASPFVPPAVTDGHFENDPAASANVHSGRGADLGRSHGDELRGMAAPDYRRADGDSDFPHPSAAAAAAAAAWHVGATTVIGRDGAEVGVSGGGGGAEVEGSLLTPRSASQAGLSWLLAAHQHNDRQHLASRSSNSSRPPTQQSPARPPPTGAAAADSPTVTALRNSGSPKHPYHHGSTSTPAERSAQQRPSPHPAAGSHTGAPPKQPPPFGERHAACSERDGTLGPAEWHLQAAIARSESVPPAAFGGESRCAEAAASPPATFRPPLPHKRSESVPPPASTSSSRAVRQLRAATPVAIGATACSVRPNSVPAPLSGGAGMIHQAVGAGATATSGRPNSVPSPHAAGSGGARHPPVRGASPNWLPSALPHTDTGHSSGTGGGGCSGGGKRRQQHHPHALPAVFSHAPRATHPPQPDLQKKVTPPQTSSDHHSGSMPWSSSHGACAISGIGPGTGSASVKASGGDINEGAGVTGWRGHLEPTTSVAGSSSGSSSSMRWRAKAEAVAPGQALRSGALPYRLQEVGRSH